MPNPPPDPLVGSVNIPDPKFAGGAKLIGLKNPVPMTGPETPKMMPGLSGATLLVVNPPPLDPHAAVLRLPEPEMITSFPDSVAVKTTAACDVVASSAVRRKKVGRGILARLVI